MTDVAAQVIEVIRKKIRVDRAEITVNDKLTDLGLESLDAIEMVFDLEEKFDIEIPLNANEAQLNMETVGDVVQAVEGVIAKKAKPA